MIDMRSTQRGDGQDAALASAVASVGVGAMIALWREG
jgi:hypothetical protein